MTVLVVSPEPSILRLLHRLLTAFGYAVTTRRDISWTSSGGYGIEPHFLILDSRALDVQGRPLAGLRDHITPPFPYVLLLQDDDSKLDLADLIDAGVDDFLERPVNRAEVLARLRAGARYLEWRQQAEDLSQTDPVTGLMAEGAFARLLQRHTAKTAAPGCCVLLKLDHFDQVQAAIGWPAARGVLRAISDLLREQCGPDQPPAILPGGRFSVSLPQTTLEQARKWTERLREGVERYLGTQEVEALRLTASAGVSAWLPGVDTPEALMARTRAALDHAVQGGGNCTVVASEVGGNGSDPFDGQDGPCAGAKACDVMMPSTLLLESTETVSSAAAKLQRAQLDFALVVDRQCRLEGIICREDLSAIVEARDTDNRPVRTVMTTAVGRVQEGTPLAAVLQHLSDSEMPVVVVVRGEAPSGFITRDHLNSIVRPLAQQHGATRQPGGSVVFPAADGDVELSSYVSPLWNS